MTMTTSESSAAPRVEAPAAGEPVAAEVEAAVTPTVEPAAPAADALLPAASLFHSFSDPNRLVILHHLQLGEHRVVDLTEHLGLSQSTVSKHLACLKAAGMVESRAVGRASVYSLKHAEALVDLLSAAERMLELTGDAVTLCPLHGTAVIAGRR